MPQQNKDLLFVKPEFHVWKLPLQLSGGLRCVLLWQAGWSQRTVHIYHSSLHTFPTLCCHPVDTRGESLNTWFCFFVLIKIIVIVIYSIVAGEIWINCPHLWFLYISHCIVALGDPRNVFSHFKTCSWQVDPETPLKEQKACEHVNCSLAWESTRNNSLFWLISGTDISIYVITKSQAGRF